MQNRMIIVSTVGTSILNNLALPEERKKLTLITNKSEANLETSAKEEILKLAKKAKEEIGNLTIEEVKKRSAELNGIYSFLDKKSYKNVHHIFIETDTFQGKVCVDILEEWFMNRGEYIERHKIPDLNTSDSEAFQLALADLAKWCIERLVPEKIPYCSIVFNLTGGYKSIQGFMQTLGMFYANQTVYVFEGAPLLTIPNLPINIDKNATQIIENNITLFRQLSFSPKNKNDIPPTIPEIMLFSLDDKIQLSAWGEIFFQKFCDTAYHEKIFSNPLESHIIFSEKFIRDVNSHKSKFYDINIRIDDFAKFILNHNNPDRLSFHPLQGDHSPSTHEFYAWSDGGAYRVYCHQESSKWVLDKLDVHLK